jgi:hypothetical protein
MNTIKRTLYLLGLFFAPDICPGQAMKDGARTRRSAYALLTRAEAAPLCRSIWRCKKVTSKRKG